MFLLCSSMLFSQDQKALLSGTIKDALSDQPVDFVTVYIKNTNTATESDENGKWQLQVPANERIILVFRRLGYKETNVDVEPLPTNAKQQTLPKITDIEKVYNL